MLSLINYLKHKYFKSWLSTNIQETRLTKAHIKNSWKIFKTQQ